MGTILYKWVNDNEVEFAGPFRCQEEIDVFKQVDGSNWGSLNSDSGYDTIDDAVSDVTACENVDFWYSDTYGDWKSAVVRSVLPGWINAAYLDASKDYYRFYDISDSFDEILALVPYNDALSFVWEGCMLDDGDSWETYRRMLELPNLYPSPNDLTARMSDMTTLNETGFSFYLLLHNLDALDAFADASPAVQKVLADALSNKLTDLDYVMLNQCCWDEWAEMIDSGVPIEDVF